MLFDALGFPLSRRESRRIVLAPPAYCRQLGNVRRAVMLGGGKKAPPAPTGLTATVGGPSLSWTESAGDTGGTNVYRSTSSSGPFTKIANVAQGTATFTDSGSLTAGTTYYYYVTAVGAGGESAASSTANAQAGLRYSVSAWGIQSIWAEGSLTADLVGSNTLTANNTPTLVASVVGNGINFASASSQYCNVASNSSLVTGAGDFAAWCWVKPTTLGNQRIYFGKTADSSTAATMEWMLLCNGSGKWSLGTSNGTTIYQAQMSVAVSAGVAALVFAWYDSVGGNIHVCVNTANTVSASAAAAPQQSTQAVGIGGSGVGSNFANAVINQAGFAKGQTLGNGGMGTLSLAMQTAIYNGGSGLAY